MYFHIFQSITYLVYLFNIWSRQLLIIYSTVIFFLSVPYPQKIQFVQLTDEWKANVKKQSYTRCKFLNFAQIAIISNDSISGQVMCILLEKAPKIIKILAQIWVNHIIHLHIFIRKNARRWRTFPQRVINLNAFSQK